jgi:hypothetical protein
MSRTKNAERKEYQSKLDQARKDLMYAQCYTPSKVGYYQYIVTNLLNSAPVGII